ncbi:hypothetical protein R6Q59_036529 [Mikania micrantha]
MSTTPSTVSNEEWWEETDKKFQAWPRTAGPPVVMNPISRQNFIVKSRKEDQFLILSAMSPDLLSIQVFTVASNRLFCVPVISLRSTILTLHAVEMSICLKDHLDAAERIRHTTSLEGEMEYERVVY